MTEKKKFVNPFIKMAQDAKAAKEEHHPDAKTAVAKDTAKKTQVTVKKPPTRSAGRGR